MVRTEGHLFVLREVMAYRGFLLIELESEEIIRLFGKVLYQESILTPGLYFQPELLIDGMVPPYMIKVSMGCQQMHGLQPLIFDITADGTALLWVLRPTVDDDTLLCLVTYHVAVFLQHVTHKPFDIQHGR